MKNEREYESSTSGNSDTDQNNEYTPGQLNRSSLLRVSNQIISSGLVSPAINDNSDTNQNMANSVGRTEIHVNLQEPQKVRLFKGRINYDYNTSGGEATERLISCDPHEIIAMTPGPTYRWGLRNFAQITNEGIGFHSNLCNPRRDTLCRNDEFEYCGGNGDERIERNLIVDGTSRSHGCLRLSDSDSLQLYSLISTHVKVYIYKRSAFRAASWTSAEDRAGHPDCIPPNTGAAPSQP